MLTRLPELHKQTSYKLLFEEKVERKSLLLASETYSWKQGGGYQWIPAYGYCRAAPPPLTTNILAFQHILSQNHRNHQIQ